MDDVIAAARRSLARTEAGPGSPDDGHPGVLHVRIKSIPFLSTERLERRLAHLDHVLSTPEGMATFDQPRRALVHLGVHRQAIRHELALRSEEISEI